MIYRLINELDKIVREIKTDVNEERPDLIILESDQPDYFIYDRASSSFMITIYKRSTLTLILQKE